MIVLSKNIYETCVTILCSTLGKREVKMSLNETDSWVWKGSETTCGMYGKTDSETIGEMFNETNSKQNEKMTSNLLCPQKTIDRNISSPIFFTSPKVKLHLCRCHRPQSRWDWQMSLPSDLLGNFVEGTPDDG
jgi:hypothetical protein